MNYPCVDRIPATLPDGTRCFVEVYSPLGPGIVTTAGESGRARSGKFFLELAGETLTVLSKGTCHSAGGIVTSDDSNAFAPYIGRP